MCFSPFLLFLHLNPVSGSISFWVHNAPAQGGGGGGSATISVNWHPPYVHYWCICVWVISRICIKIEKRKAKGGERERSGDNEKMKKGTIKETSLLLMSGRFIVYMHLFSHENWQYLVECDQFKRQSISVHIHTWTILESSGRDEHIERERYEETEQSRQQ